MAEATETDFSHSSGDQASADALLLEAPGRNLFHASLLASGGCWAIPGIPGIAAASLWALPLLSYSFLPFVSLCVCSFLIRPPVNSFKVYLNPGWPHVSQLYLQRPYFQIRSILRFQVDISFRGDPVQLTTQAYGFCLNKSVINTQLSKGILFCWEHMDSIPLVGFEGLSKEIQCMSQQSKQTLLHFTCENESSSHGQGCRTSEFK